jgi:hypothetical protein
MKRTVSATAALLLVLSAAPRVPAADDESPRAIVERAIKAHGGQERLEKLKADRVTLKGTMLVNDNKAEFTAETTVNMPSQFRNVVNLKFDTSTRKVVQILNGDKVIVTVDDDPKKDIPASAVAEMREILQLERATRLAPLLSDKSFELAALGEGKVHDKPAVVVKVSSKKHADLKMYFDKESGLLVKTEHDLTEGKQKVTQEEFYSEFKEIGGYKRPTKLVVFRAGKKLMDAELVDVKYLDKVDETLFTKP